MASFDLATLIIPCLECDVFALVIATVAPRVPAASKEVSVHELAFVALTFPVAVEGFGFRKAG